MRTTIRIDDELLKKAKELAALSGKSLTSIIEDALRESLARQQLSGPREPVHLTTFTGKGLLPGVDLDDTADLMDLMESQDDSH
jgi:Bacterial antitoxin of type II TA system, VapB